MLLVYERLPYLSVCLVGLVWYCGKMYSLHPFSYGGCQVNPGTRSKLRFVLSGGVEHWALTNCFSLAYCENTGGVMRFVSPSLRTSFAEG